MIVPPPYVLAPLSVSVPELILVRAPAVVVMLGLAVAPDPVVVPNVIDGAVV